MNSTDAYLIAQWAAGGAAGLVAIAIFLQKFLNSWKESKAENSILSILHTELERMAVQNTIMGTELGKLQLEIIQLNKELRLLTEENQRLHSEVTALTGEVARLQAILLKQGAQRGLSS
jgi:predicted nuclease with TOPRIM domain